MNLRTLALLAALAAFGCRERATLPSGTAAGRSTPAPAVTTQASPAPAATSTTLDAPAYREWARQMGSPAAPAPAAPTPAAADDHGHIHEADGAARIGAAELKAKLDAGDAVVVDVRNREQWEWSRIPGAVHISYPELFARSAELPHEALIALYCT